MAKTIKGNEIIEDNHLRNAIKEAELLKKAYDDLDKVVKVLATDVKNLSKSATGTTAADIQKLNKAVQDSTNIRNSTIKLDQEKIKLQKLEIDLNNKLVREAEKKAKADKKLADENRKLNSVYEQNKRRLNEMAKALKELESRGKGSGRVAKGLREEFDKLHKSVFSAEKSVGQFQRNVGNYPRVLGGAIDSMRNFAASFGLVLGASAVFRDVFNIVKTNEDAFASLSAITGLTGEKFEVFKVAINDVATELKVSSTEVASAAEKIASAQPALLENADALAAVTKEAILLSKATGGDLTETSLALVGVMNQFSMAADEASRVINVLAAGSQAGAATVEQINQSMVKFGSTADLMNVSLEESVAVIETLGEKAIFGEQAGTAFRNILLKMGSIDVLPEKALKQLEKYGVDTEKVKDTTISFEERLRELSKIASDSTAIMQVFGTENATAATVLLNNIDTYNHMNEAVTGTNVAYEQAAINSDTLSNVIKELRAAWENWVVGVMNGTDAMGTLKNVLRFVADNLGTIMKIVLISVKAWASYKIAMMLFRREVDETGKVISKGLIPALTNSVKGVNSLSTLMKSIPFAGWVSILVTLVPLVFDLAKGLFESGDGAKELTLAEETLNDVTKKTSERLAQEEAELLKVFTALKNTKQGTEERQMALDHVNSKYGTTLKNLDDEAMFVKQVDQAYKDLLATLEKRIKFEVVQESMTELLKKRLQLQKTELALQKQLALEMDGINKTFQDFDVNKVFDAGVGRSATETTLFGIQGQIEEVNKALAALESDLEDSSFSDLFGTTENAGSTSGSKVDAEKAKLDKLAELRRRHADELIRLENEMLEAGIDRELIDQAIHERRKELYKDEIDFIEELNFKTREEYDKTNNALLKLIESEKNLRLEREVNTIESNARITESENAFVDTMLKATEELAKREEEARERRKKMAEESIELMKKVTDALAREIDRRIEIQKGEVEDSQREIDFLREQAALGNIDAAESIKAEQVALAKKQLEIEELERKKRNLLVITTGLEAASQKINAGDGNAFKNVSSEIADFIASLPKFYTGTETTVADALGKPVMSGKDGYITRVDGSEMILNGAKVKALQSAGLNTTSDVANAALEYSGAIVNRKSFAGSENVIASKLDRVEQAIKQIEIPEHQFNFDEQNKMFIHTIKQGNKTLRNHQKTGGLFS